MSHNYMIVDDTELMSLPPLRFKSVWNYFCNTSIKLPQVNLVARWFPESIFHGIDCQMSTHPVSTNLMKIQPSSKFMKISLSSNSVAKSAHAPAGKDCNYLVKLWKSL